MVAQSRQRSNGCASAPRCCDASLLQRRQSVASGTRSVPPYPSTPAVGPLTCDIVTANRLPLSVRRMMVDGRRQWKGCRSEIDQLGDTSVLRFDNVIWNRHLCPIGLREQRPGRREAVTLSPSAQRQDRLSSGLRASASRNASARSVANVLHAASITPDPIGSPRWAASA